MVANERIGETKGDILLHDGTYGKDPRPRSFSESENVEPTILPFSQLTESPESSHWYDIPAKIVLVLFSAMAFVFLLCSTPVIILFDILQRIRRSQLTYRKHPSNVRVAMIGGGWSGLQCMSRLQELGVNHVKGFERYDSWGGTWHPNLRYHTIQIHGPMWITSFKDFPYSRNQDINDGKILGEETQNYVHRFGIEKKLGTSYTFNSRVIKIKYSTDTRTAMLVVENYYRQQRTEGPFDFVIYAAQASEPNIPNIPDRKKFEGEVYHSLDFKKEQYDNIVKKNAKVVVVGGSKAGCDLVLCLERGGHKNYHWLYRKPYLFWKYEIMFHNRSFLNMLRGFTTILGLLMSLVSAYLTGLIFWASGLATTYSQAHNDWNKFHFGILCPRQRRDLAKIPQGQIIRGNPTKFTTGGLQLADGADIPADVVLFATGCESDINKIHLKKDSVTYHLDLTNKMLKHFIFSGFLVLANSTALWTTFGPVRADNSA